MLSKFAPNRVQGHAVRVSGVLAYNFVSAEKVDVLVRAMKAEKPTEAEMRVMGVARKLHFWLFAVAERLAVGDAKPNVNETAFIRDGKADIRIHLSTISPTVVARLRAAGLDAISEKGGTVLGRIPIEKLIVLAEIEEVKLILPKI